MSAAFRRVLWLTFTTGSVASRALLHAAGLRSSIDNLAGFVAGGH
jgi:hypothetical protein